MDLICEKYKKKAKSCKCPICLNLVLEPVECVKYENIFCETFAKKIKNQLRPRCPMKRSGIF